MTPQIGKTLREFRVKNGLTQFELARKSGIPSDHISRIELGKTTSPRLQTLEILATALGIKITNFFEQSEAA